MNQFFGTVKKRKYDEGDKIKPAKAMQRRRSMLNWMLGLKGMWWRAQANGGS